MESEDDSTMSIEFISGGVCSAKGFSAAGIHCGIRANKGKKDLALIKSEVPAQAAAVYTTNLVKGAPLIVTKEHLLNGSAQAIVCNSGIANTCCANGYETAAMMSEITAKALGILPENVVVASTGVIGRQLDVSPIQGSMPDLVKSLDASEDASNSAALAIMTTDTIIKSAAVEFSIGKTVCHLGGIAKGSGMIHPNMATMLVFLTTDAAVSSEMLQKALSHDVQNTFNMTSVDGDTSTNDMVVLMANGMAGNQCIAEPNDDFRQFMKALNTVTLQLCRLIAGDGEGATKLLECHVSGADTLETARKAAKSVICSSLVKAAMFGADANWGRVLCALGYSGASINPETVDVRFKSRAGKVDVCTGGSEGDYSEETAKEVLSEKEIDIIIDLHMGNEEATAWGCDLTYDYVKINGDYRT